MKDLTENISTHLLAWGELTEVVMNLCSLLCVAAGVIISVVASIQERRRSAGAHPMHTYFRRMFGGWLIVALEFQLAADIVGTMITPTTNQVIQLGAVALIRTFLNYFLNMEMKLHEDAEPTHSGKEEMKELTFVQERD